MTTYVHVQKTENENLTQDDWNNLSAAVGYISSTGMEGKANKNGSATEDFAAKKMTVHEDLTLQSGVAVNQFSSDATLAGNSDTTVATEKAVKTYADTKAKLAGDTAQDFAANNLIVNGNLEVTGSTISKDIEHMQGDVTLGDSDADTVMISGRVKTANTSGQLMIEDATQIQGSLTVQTGVAINEFSSDTTLADNSDTAVPTEKAVKTYTDGQLATKADQTTLDMEFASMTNQLASKAAINGDSAQDFAAKDVTIDGNLSVGGNLQLTGDFNKAVEESARGSLQGDVALGGDDNSTIQITGKLVSAHSSGHLVIDSPLQVKTSTTAIDQFSTDGTLAGNSDTTVATEKAVKTYADEVQQAAQTYAKNYTDGITTNSIINNTVNSDADLNTLQTAGVYAVGRDNVNLPADMPMDSDFNILTVYQHGTDNSGVQILRSADSDGADKCVFTYQRSWHQQDWSDWQQSLYINNAGKVGVGTSTPSATLEIRGDLMLNSGGAVDQFSTDATLAGNSDTSVATEKAVKTYADTKAKLAGDTAQDFATNNLKVNGNLEVVGTTISKDIEHMQGDVKLGDGDTDTVTISGRVKTANTSGQLIIEDATQIQDNLTLQTGVAINEYSSDTTLADNSDTAVPTEKAVKTYADTKAKLAGDSSQFFEASSMTVHGGLKVRGTLGAQVNNYRYISQSAAGYWYGDSDYTISLLAHQRIAASEFMAYSDRRIKKDLSLTDNQEDLQTLNKLALTNYHYIDTVTQGSDQHKKLIAQQVEEVYPQAVSRHEEFIPDIYKPSVSTHYDESNQQVKIVLDAEHNLSESNEVRLITDAGQEDYEVVVVADAYSFVVKSARPLSEVFVFGKKVTDFRHIDYTAISMLGVSATQQLSRENEQLREETAQLRQLLESYSARLDALEKNV